MAEASKRARGAGRDAPARATNDGSQRRASRGPDDTGAEQVELAEAELYRVLSPERLAEVAESLVERRFKRGRVLFFEGEAADQLWTIKSGQLRQYKSSPDGHITTLDVLGPGQMFGAVSALESEFYPASAEGVVSGVAWCLPRRVFLALLQERPELAVEVLRVVTGRLSEAHERVRSLSHDPAPSRLAQALLRAAEAGEARVTRRALSEVAGTTVETAIRVLRGFERERLIEGDVGRIRIVDEAALREIAGRSRG